MNRLAAILVMSVLAAGFAQAADVELSWNAPTTNEDGTTLTDLDTNGYNIYYGTESGNYSDLIQDVTPPHIISNMLDNTVFYIAVTASDLTGNESTYSEELEWDGSDTIKPSPPTGIQAIWRRIIAWLFRPWNLKARSV